MLSVVCHTVIQAHIANLLTATRSLRTVRLNLDFHDSPAPACFWYWNPPYWKDHEPIHRERGLALAAVLRAGLPLLERFTLLRHGENSSKWIPYVPDGGVDGYGSIVYK